MRERVVLVICCAMLLAPACQGTLEDMGADGGDPDDPGGDGGPGGGERGLAGGGLAIDTSPTNPFVFDFPTEYPVNGTVEAPYGLATLTVDGASPMVADGGNFGQVVAVERGMHTVAITATDLATPMNTRRADLSLLVTDYRPEGQLNPRGAALGLTDEVLGLITGVAADMIGDIDIAEELRRSGSMSMSGCSMTINDVTHGPLELDLVVDPAAGGLVAVATLSNLHLTFSGACNLFITSTTFRGTVDTDFMLRTALSAPQSETCIVGLQHTVPEVTLPGFDVTVDMDGSGFLTMIMELVISAMDGMVADMVAEQASAMIDEMLTEELGSASLFEMGETMDLMGATAEVNGCLTGLGVTPEGAVSATIGFSARNAGTAVLEGPGAPYLGTPMPTPDPGVLLLDTGFISQIIYTAWTGGLFMIDEAATLPLSTVALLAPDLEDRFPGATDMSIAVEGRLPALVTAAPADSETGGDMVVELGNFEVILTVNGEEAFRIGVHMALTLELAPEGAGIMPLVIDADADVCVLYEAVDIDDAALEDVVRLQIDTMAAELLGGAAITIPDVGLGFSINVEDAWPVPETNYVAIAFSMGGTAG